MFYSERQVGLLLFLLATLLGCGNSATRMEAPAFADPTTDTLSVYFSSLDAANGILCGGQSVYLVCVPNCNTQNIRYWLPDSLAQSSYYGGIVVDMVAVVQTGDTTTGSLEPKYILAVRNYATRDTVCLKTALLVCGTEPFWQLTVPELPTASLYGTEVSTFSLVGLEIVESLMCTTPELIQSSQSHFTLQFEDLAHKKYSVQLNKRPCSDGMSDLEYPYEATVFITETGQDTITLRGCAEPHPYRRTRRP